MSINSVSPILHARSTDPGTSHAALASIGSDCTVRAKILASLQTYGPSTSHEIAERTGLSLVTVSPTIAPLRRKDLVIDTNIKRDGRTVWAIKEATH